MQKRFNFQEESIEVCRQSTDLLINLLINVLFDSLDQMYAEKVSDRGLCAIAQCESLRYKLIGGLAVRRACYGLLSFIMESGAKGCEVVVSGKLRGQRAKSMKFVDGWMIHSGEPINDYVDTAVRHVLLRQGVFGIKVSLNSHSIQLFFFKFINQFFDRILGQNYASVGSDRKERPETSTSRSR